MTGAGPASAMHLGGDFAFGLVGRYLYFINRYHKEGVKVSDLVTVIGAVGGAAVLAVFPAGTDLFGAYGIRLAFGFFAYLLVLFVLVQRSKNFDVDWFLDGRWREPAKNQTTEGAEPTLRPMEDRTGLPK